MNLKQRDPKSHLKKLPRIGSVICSCYGRRMVVFETWSVREGETVNGEDEPGDYVRMKPEEKLRWDSYVVWPLEKCFPEREEQLELF